MTSLYFRELERVSSYDRLRLGAMFKKCKPSIQTDITHLSSGALKLSDVKENGDRAQGRRDEEEQRRF